MRMAVHSVIIVSIHASAREATTTYHPAARCHYVSIHASAREATIHGIEQFFFFCVSIHASAREATSIATTNR